MHDHSLHNILFKFIVCLALYFKSKPHTNYTIFLGNVLQIEAVAVGYPLPILASWEYNSVNIQNQTDARIYHNEYYMPDKHTLRSVMTISNTTKRDSGSTVSVKFHHPLETITSVTSIRVVGMASSVWLVSEFCSLFDVCTI